VKLLHPAATRYERKCRVNHRRDDLRNTRRNQGISTRRCFSLVRTRLECYVGCRTFGIGARSLECGNLGMRLAGLSMPAFAYDMAIVH
jgi:hypothetical protein